MSRQKVMGMLVGVILLLSLVSAGYGAFSNEDQGQSEFQSVHGESVPLYGKGLYRYDSESVALQAIAQDRVTLFFGIPLLLFSLIWALKGSIRGKLILTGTIGYFLYTYCSYSFFAMYNPFFIVYVALMSASFFAFILAFKSIDVDRLKASFSKAAPVKAIGGFLILFSVLIALMWLGRIYGGSEIEGVPAGLEHYSTLIIQAMDLGFVVPVSILAGVTLIRKAAIGYLLASVVIIKDITLATAVSAMAIMQYSKGMDASIAEMTIFPLINLLMLVGMYFILKNIKD